MKRRWPSSWSENARRRAASVCVAGGVLLMILGGDSVGVTLAGAVATAAGIAAS